MTLSVFKTTENEAGHSIMADQGGKKTFTKSLFAVSQ